MSGPNIFNIICQDIIIPIVNWILQKQTNLELSRRIIVDVKLKKIHCYSLIL